MNFANIITIAVVAWLAFALYCFIDEHDSNIKRNSEQLNRRETDGE